MPSLLAFGRKWRVGSDDFVFPYCLSIIFRLFWFILITTILVDYDKNYMCKDEKILKIYLFVLTGLHFIMVIIETVVIVISSRGTIANPEPRNKIAIVLYIQFGIFVLEFCWDIVGVLWAYDPSIDCHRSHRVLIFTRIVLIWNFCISVSVGLYMFIRIGVCHLLPCCCNPEKKFFYEKYDPITSYDGYDLLSLSSDEKLRHRHQRTWQYRIYCLNCLVCLKGGRSDIYADVSVTLSDMFTYFRGYVPSDIIAGMALHAMHKDNKGESLNSYTRRLLDFRSSPTHKHFERVVRYVKFAAAAYGLEAYVHSKGILCCLPIYLKAGLCNWFYKCMMCRHKVGMGIHGECCGKNIKTIQLVTGIPEEDVIYSSFSAEVYCPAFYVACDHEMKSVVIAIRGTFSISDVFTDLSYQPQILQTHEEGDIYGHKGMMSRAHGLLLKLESEKILQRAFKNYPSYRLVIVGHSMGAATASLLAIILKPQYPRLHCFGYSPPGCVINMGAVAYTRSFITSVVFENDIISRFSLESFEQYSLQILHCLQTAHVPKYRIMLDSFLYWMGWCRPCLSKVNRMKSVTDLTIEKDAIHVDSDYIENDVYDVVADARKLLSTDLISGKTRIAPRPKIPLFIPGRIIHVTWKESTSRCCGLIKVKSLQAHWTVQSDFTELIIKDGVIHSHFPYVIMKYLIELEKSLNI